jgi:hypothetical protein
MDKDDNEFDDLINRLEDGTLSESGLDLLEDHINKMEDVLDEDGFSEKLISKIVQLRKQLRKPKVTFQDEQKDTVFLTQQDNYDNM